VTAFFALPDDLSAKADPALIGVDEQHFSEIEESLRRAIAELTERIDATRLQAGGSERGSGALERDLEVHRLSGRLRALRRYGVDLCLGHMVSADDAEPVYVGRLGLADGAGRRLLVDWRSPAAEPFFAATHARPMGLSSRRRYRWTAGRVTDYWDEVFDAAGLDGHAAALDDQSAFIASLGGARSDRMQDVLGTIAADQDAIVRAGSRGALVVDGGPGTGKTVVALHRTAYLLYADPRLGHRRGGVLFVGPHQPYLAYVSDVLPSLGEEGVRTCTIRDLVREGPTVDPEPDPQVARLKSTAAMVRAIEPAVGLYEEPPAEGLEVVTPWGDLWLSSADWSDAFEAVAGIPHNEARDQILEELADLLIERCEDPEVPLDDLRLAVLRDAELREALARAWPMLEPTDLVGDLWDVPAYLRRCAPWLEPDEVRLLQRDDPQAWTVSDLPLLDAARQRLGDRAASGIRRRKQAALAAQRAEMDLVVDSLVAAEEYGDGEGLGASLRQDGLREALVDEDVVPDVATDPLAGPFAHIVVDEAQELTDAEWQMLLLRCPSRSMTIVGDRAQARHGFAESWTERLERVGFERIELTGLRINYRTPEEVMAEAAPVILAALPDANVPTSVRSTGVPVLHGPLADLDRILDEWLAEHADGVACVISADGRTGARPRVRALTPELAKGLEFDLVVLVDPDDLGPGIEGAVDRYVAMTRATQRLVVLTG
jgi:hypothetical protein